MVAIGGLRCGHRHEFTIEIRMHLLAMYRLNLQRVLVMISSQVTKDSGLLL
jgi:hypothetical protein